MRTQQGSADGVGSWELVRGRPDPRLRGMVLDYRGHRLELAVPRRRLEVPTGLVTLAVGFDQPLRLTDAVRPERSERFGSLVCGLRRTATIGEHTGRTHGVTVALTPAAAWRVLGPVLGDLGNEWAGLAEVMGPAGRDLPARLADAPDWPARFALLDRLLLTRLSAGPVWAPEVTRAWELLHRSRGTAPVRLLSEETGWSPRRLEARFRAQVGLPPKQVAQVVRLRRVLRAFDADPGLGGAGIAALCGFHDQAHLVRTFRAMTGSTPGRFFGHRAAAGPAAPPTDRLDDRVTTAVLPVDAPGPDGVRIRTRRHGGRPSG
ncbi:helix-turn-helix domain-containing protein [Streptacidiphilus griseoplanus]|uniref:helix-turn-helix domain-containing protein n=1 Tax=Peterkaempfera griseoplana TaxID=66896 RepID=UPI0006E18085|nr:helix-turn-helix domain-containing protein [Peterkaempfera griseoplana]